MDGTGADTQNFNSGVQSVSKRKRKKKRSNKKSLKKKVAERKYKENLMNTLLKAGCLFLDKPENISIAALEYAEFTLQLQGNKRKNKSRKFKKKLQKGVNTPISKKRDNALNNFKRARYTTLNNDEQARYNTSNSDEQARCTTSINDEQARYTTSLSDEQARCTTSLSDEQAIMLNNGDITSNSDLSKVNSSVKTDSTLNTLCIETNYSPIMTRSRTAALKNMTTSEHPSKSQDNLVKDNMTTSEHPSKSQDNLVKDNMTINYTLKSPTSKTNNNRALNHASSVTSSKYGVGAEPLAQYRDDVVSTMSESSPTNSYPILTRSRTAFLKLAKSGVKSDVSQKIQPKKLKNNHKVKKLKSNCFPTTKTSNFNWGCKVKPDESQGMFIAQATMHYLTNGHSYAPYRYEELAMARACFDWERVNGCLNGCLRELSTNVNEAIVSDSCDNDEDDVPLLQSYFPMPHVAYPSTMNLDIIDEQCEEFTNFNTVNKTSQSSDRHSSTQKPSEKTIGKSGLYLPNSSAVDEIPTPAEDDVIPRSDNQIEQCHFSDRISDFATLYIYREGCLYNHCKGRSEIGMDHQVNISNNEETFQSDLEVNKSATHQDINSEEVVFWRETTSLFNRIRKVKLNLRKVKKMLEKRQMKPDEANKIVTDLSMDIEHLDKVMINLRSEEKCKNFSKSPDSRLKVMYPKEVFRCLNNTHQCLNNLKGLHIKIQRKIVTMLSNNCTLSNILGDSQYTINTAAASSSCATKPSTTLNKQSLGGTSDLSVTSEQLSQVLSDAHVFPAENLIATFKNSIKNRRCKEAPAHVMSENEVMYWARLQALYKEIQSSSKKIRKCLKKLCVVKNLLKFESNVDNEHLLKDLHWKLSEYHDRLEVEAKESRDFCYASRQYVPVFQSKGQKKLFVCDLKLVRSAFKRYKKAFTRLIDCIGYEHVINS